MGHLEKSCLNANLPSVSRLRLVELVRRGGTCPSRNPGLYDGCFLVVFPRLPLKPFCWLDCSFAFLLLVGIRSKGCNTSSQISFDIVKQIAGVQKHNIQHFVHFFIVFYRFCFHFDVKMQGWERRYVRTPGRRCTSGSSGPEPWGAGATRANTERGQDDNWDVFWRFFL